MGDEIKIPVALTKDQISTLAKLIDTIPGMDNARVLLPIYDALKESYEAEPYIAVNKE
jgi:hypothetical protein